MACDNIILAEKLRNDDPEQFYTLVKMHLSFVLDLNMDDSDNNTEKKIRSLKWNLPFSKKSKSYSKNCQEGSHLTFQFIEQIRHLISFLSDKENINQEGIFRRSGKVTRQQELKSLINQGVTINFNDGYFSVHDCATVLKNILSELPESVLTDAHYPAYCQIAELCNARNVNNEDRLLKSLQLLILLLPSENRTFFQDIIALLHLAASHENCNRMSADNLATLFTPHLLCPRKLSPEALHMNSQLMSRVVAFMIQKGIQLFEIPLALATDLQVYWNKKERRKLSPLRQLNESVCDGTAANTVFTFVDRERTAQENGANPTETALAQLYAYIQSLPESSKKRKLIKQFNKENGYGTPLRTTVGKKRIRSRSLGDSIKKHLPGFNKNIKRTARHSNCGEEECISPVFRDEISNVPLTEDSQNNCKENVMELTRPLINTVLMSAKKSVFENLDQEIYENEIVLSSRNTFTRTQKCLSHEALNDLLCTEKEAPSTMNTTRIINSDGEFSTDEVFIEDKRNFVTVTESSSPNKLLNNTKSEMVLNQIRATNQDVLNQWPVSTQILSNKEKINDNLVLIPSNNLQRTESSLDSSISSFKISTEPSLSVSHKTPYKTLLVRQIDSEGFVEPTVCDNKTPSRKFNNNGYQPRFTNNDIIFSSPNITNRIPIRYCSKSHLLMTSTPAPGNGCIVTPIVDKNNSMSPITRSTQRMPKAMQETMMTPRSRKPVISLSGSDLCHLANMDSFGDDYPANEISMTKNKKINDFGKKLVLEDTNEGTASDSLSSTFREYLFSRSVLNTSLVDLSFSSRTDDFLSLSENNTSTEKDDFKSLAGSILNDAALSESLLYCLDGHDPQSMNSSQITDSDPKLSEDESPCATCAGDVDEVKHIYETAL